MIPFSLKWKAKDMREVHLAVIIGFSSWWACRTMAWVYILKCSDGSYYTGSAVDLEKRIAEHMAGTFDGYTSKR